MQKNVERPNGHTFGIHRVLDKESRLPQAAEKLDNSLPIYSNEILVSVDRLNIDAASFVQMESETGGDASGIEKIVLENCRTRGKQHNRVTGSGGMLIGRVAAVGSQYKGPLKFKVGDRVATLVSLTLTPLHLEKIEKVHLKTHQIEAEGYAILFESSIAASLPDDVDQNVAMAVYDVAGAPATANALCRAKQTVVVIGAGGKAGTLSCVAARRKIGRYGKLVAVEPFDKSCQDLKGLKVCDEILKIDASDPIAVRAGVERATRGKMGDVVINVASVPNTEISSILSASPTGKILFFSMATSFTKVALGAEGIGCRSQLIFGNGYYPNHSQFALDLLRKDKSLKRLFYRRYL
jgi:L-erythro-3,5-diaminohexanoate dehydrogenase